MKMVMIMTEVFQFLIKQSISISYVIIFVMIVRFILKRFPKKYAYALWIIVAIPLLIPWHIESEFTLHPKMETTMTEMLIAPSIAKDTEDSTYMVSDDKKSVDETMPYITKEAQEEPLWILPHLIHRRSRTTPPRPSSSGAPRRSTKSLSKRPPSRRKKRFPLWAAS